MLKDNIISNSIGLFRSMGIRNVTMEMIADEIGISKRTLYEHFKTKDELVETCVQAELNRLIEKDTAITQNSSHIIETYLLFMWSHIQELRQTNYLFIKDLRQLYPSSIYCKTTEFESRIKEGIKNFIEKGKEENIFRPEVNVELATLILFEQLQLLMENGEKIFSMHYFSPAEVFEHISINFIRGMATKEGIELIDYYYSKHRLTD